jgi:hypothetical protein
MDVPLELHGDRTGNCVRVSIALEEAALAYVVSRVDLAALPVRGNPRRAVVPEEDEPAGVRLSYAVGVR